jgi:hypothetical protein
VLQAVGAFWATHSPYVASGDPVSKNMKKTATGDWAFQFRATGTNMGPLRIVVKVTDYATEMRVEDVQWSAVK